METQYLTQAHLEGFESYKYSSVDTNPLSIYVMHPFWNWVVQYCPKWVAPNVLTFVGFLFTVFNYLLFAYYDWDFFASTDNSEFPIPRWVFLLSAINIFLAYTLDGIDGKQARRTQTSGPLGELFDHGLDSWTTVLMATAMYSLFGRLDHSISPLRMFFVLWNVFINFYFPHWEKYNTGVLFLPWGYDASLVAMIIVNFITFIFGHELWNFTLPGGFSAGNLFELTFYICAFFGNLPMSVWNLYTSYRDRTGKMRSFYEAIRPMVQLIVFITIGSIWVFFSPINVVETYPRILYFFTGTVFSNICCRLIVSQMSSTRCEIFNWLLFLYTLVPIVSFIMPQELNVEPILLISATLIATIAHIHYGSCVVRQMCKHFRIDCFKIREHSQ